MDIPVERWYGAIAARTSRRVFMGRPPDEDSLARLETVCREFRPFLGVRTVLVRESPESVFKGLIGGYGKIKGAPLYAAFVADTAASRFQESVGYVGEAFVLEAAALGLGTCWVSGFFRPAAAAGHVPLEPGEKILAVTPVGYAADALTFGEKTMKTIVGSAGRKALDSLVLSGDIREEWQRRALEAARLAPSAGNRQPWRFRLEPGAVIVTASGDPAGDGGPKRLDCGIAMLHLELGARAAGVGGHWEFPDAPGIAVFRAR